MAISVQSSVSSGYAQFQYAQAQRQVAQAEARATALESQAVDAKKEAVSAQRHARDLGAKATSARSAADLAGASLTSANEITRSVNGLADQYGQIAQAVQSADSASIYVASGTTQPVTSASTGQIVDTTA